MADHDTHDHTGVTGVPSATAPNPTTIELGHASDTTLSRASAGVVAVEGTALVKAGAATTSGLTMATSRLLGRTTASSGAIEEITVGSGLSLSAGSITATGAMATDALWDAAGDLAVGTGANTAAKLTKGSQGQVLKVGATTLGYTFGLYHVHRILATVPNANETHDINTTTYVASGAGAFVHDWDAFPATHFLIAAYGQANEAAQTVTFQLTLLASPTNPISAAGDDLALTNTLGVFKSSWIAVSDATTGIQEMALARKGSTATVDFAGRWLEIHFKIV